MPCLALHMALFPTNVPRRSPTLGRTERQTMKPEIWVVMTVAGLGITCAVLRSLTVFRDRTIDEVIGYLRSIDWDELRQLFDHEQEEKIRGFWISPNFRRTQRARLDQAREFLARMCYNCLLLFQWSNTEQKDKRKHHLEYEPAVTSSIRLLVQVTRRFYWISFWIRVKIFFLSLLNFDKLTFLPIPSVVALRTVRNTDLIELYAVVKKAVEGMASVYSEEVIQQITTTM
jgi:hypothetical protein